MLSGNTMAKRVFVCLSLCVLLCGFIVPAGADSLKSAPLSRGATQNGMVRIRLSSLGNPSSLKLTVNGSYTVNGKTSRAISSGSVLQVGFSSSTGQLTLTHNGTTNNMGTTFKLRRHATDGSNGIKIAQGRVPSNLYPGDFEFVSKKGSAGYTLYVIVHVYIEDYLYGVLPYEMGNSSGLEALKAQAVTARTYTMRAMSASSSNLYDVVDTTSDQVYSGTPSGNANCKAAVDATKGIVSKNGSAFTATYYSASNGGQTESVKNAWGSNSYSYLKVKDDPYDLANPASQKRSVTVLSSGTQSNAALQTLLNNKAAAKFGAGATVTGVTDIRLHTPKYASPSKLYTKADFTVRYNRNGNSGTGTITFHIFDELEAPLGMSINSGSNELWSVDSTANGFILYARRYGHGIGMSQRGAMYMAQLGYTYDQILAFYFEGCTRVQYTFTRSILSSVIEGQESSEETIVEKPADMENEKDYVAIVSPQGGTSLLDNIGGVAMVHLPQGAKVNVCSENNSHFLVTYGSLCGYVVKSDMQHNGGFTGDNIAPTRLYGYGKVVNSNALNLRTAPSMTNSTVMTTVPGKTVLPIFSATSQWAYVQYGLRVGYVSMDYIELVNKQPAATPTNIPGQNNTGLMAKVTTASGSLNLRKSASSNAMVLTTIPQYTVVPVKQNLGSWCEVVYSGQTGYVMSKFLTFVSDQATQAPAPTQAPDNNQQPAQYARVTTVSGSLNLRQAMSSSAKVLRTIPQYDVMQVIHPYGDWCQVSYSGVTGYVMTKFITFVSMPASPTAAPLPTATPAPTKAPVATDVPQYDGNMYAKVTTVQGSLNLRESENGRVLRTIPQYETLQVLQKGSSWCRVLYAGQTGYVMSKYLTFLNSSTPKPTEKPVVQPTQKPDENQNGTTAQVVTESGSLNLRYAPNGRVLCTIPQYAQVKVISYGSAWSYVNYLGTSGYVMTKFLAFDKVVSPTVPPVVTTPAPTKAPVQQPSGGNIVCYAIVDTVTGSLNLRQEAGSGAAVLCTIPQNETVPVYQKGTVWSKVSYNGTVGFVMSKFLTYVNEQDNNSSQNGQKPGQSTATYLDPTLKALDLVILGKVNSGGTYLNMREYCTTQARVLTEMPQNTYVVISQVGEEWCQVVYENKTGYCLTKYLEFDLP